VIDSVITFNHTKNVSADISFTIQVKIASGTNYSIGQRCTMAGTAYPIYCAVSDVLSGSIQYTINLTQGSILVDQISSTTPASIGD
jgi:hypothetical protein